MGSALDCDEENRYLIITTGVGNGILLGDVMRYASVLALGLAFGLSANGATAADLGGNCCADLEERIAELEATTARKGNRKVSLEIYGQVNEALMYWDDGKETGAYVVTNDNARSRFGFKGSAKIAGDWKAGFNLEIGVRSVNSKRAHQDNDEGNDTLNDVGMDIRHAYWYVDSKTYGRIAVGTTGGAAEGVTEINLAATKDIAKYSDIEDSGMGMAVRQKSGNFLNNTGNVVNGTSQTFTWRRFVNDTGNQAGEGNRRELVKYETAEILGFNGIVNWGEDDFWEVGARYKGEIGQFKIAAGIAYGENKESRVSQPVGVANLSQVGFECVAQGSQVLANTGKDADCDQIGGSISIMHESGIYLNAAGGILTDNLVTRSNRWNGVAGVDDESTFWALEAGIEKKWLPIGKTTLYGQYNQNDTGATTRTVNIDGFAGSHRVVDSQVQAYGIGVIQGIDAAAMHIYLTYRHYEADMTVMSGGDGTTGTLRSPDLEDLDIVMTGAIIKF